MTVSTDNSTAFFSELKKRAIVDKSEASKYTLKRWVSSVGKLYEKGDLEFLNQNLEDAYVFYMKGCSIMVEIVGKHQSVKDIKKDPIYLNLKARTGEVVLSRLEYLNESLQAKENATFRSGEVMDSAMDRLPPLNGEGLLDLPTVPTHALGNQYIFPKQSTSPQNLKMPEPQHVPLQQVPQNVPQTTSQQNHQSVPEPKQKQSEYNCIIELPAPTSFHLTAPILSIEPRQLASWIVKHGKEPQPTVLLLDVRPRSIHCEGLIQHRWVAQIEPLVIKSDTSSTRIEESMVINPEAEQIMFEGRNQFDIVVYYDQNSNSVQDNVVLGCL
ncbi:hypothetical protein BY458DRAFT_495065, partial [Sporodiniella umbellata]